MTQPMPPWPARDPDYIPELSNREVTCIEILTRIWQLNQSHIYPTKWRAVNRPTNARTRSNRYQMITRMMTIGLIGHDPSLVDPEDKRNPQALFVTDKGKKEIGYWAHMTRVSEYVVKETETTVKSCESI